MSLPPNACMFDLPNPKRCPNTLRIWNLHYKYSWPMREVCQRLTSTYLRARWGHRFETGFAALPHERLTCHRLNSIARGSEWFFNNWEFLLSEIQLSFVTSSVAWGTSSRVGNYVLNFRIRNNKATDHLRQRWSKCHTVSYIYGWR